MSLPARFGPYMLLKSLGSGGMGDVFLARPIEPHRGVPAPVVIKRLHASLSKEEQYAQRFTHEAKVAMLVDSLHVAKAFDAGAVGNVLYIAMEYVAGWPLSRVLEQCVEQQRPPSLEAVAEVICGLLEGLGALHDARDPDGRSLGIVHRDISPKNIMLGEDQIVRVIDLGIGRSTLQDWRTAAGQLIGTLGYMAPEQALGNALDHRTDLYAAGLVMFELLTLEPYIQQAGAIQTLCASMKPIFRTASSLRADVPSALDRVLERALAIRPEDRFQSAAELAEAIESAIPARSSHRAMQSLLSEMLLAERESERTEVMSLVEAAELPSTVVETTVFAMRSGVRPDRGAIVVPSFVMPRATARPLRRALLLTAGATLVLALLLSSGQLSWSHSQPVMNVPETPPVQVRPHPSVVPLPEPPRVEKVDEVERPHLAKRTKASKRSDPEPDPEPSPQLESEAITLQPIAPDRQSEREQALRLRAKTLQRRGRLSPEASKTVEWILWETNASERALTEMERQIKELEQSL